MYSAFDEPKSKWPSGVMISMMPPHSDPSGNATFEAYVETSEQKGLWASVDGAFRPDFRRPGPA